FVLCPLCWPLVVVSLRSPNTLPSMSNMPMTRLASIDEGGADRRPHLAGVNPPLGRLSIRRCHDQRINLQGIGHAFRERDQFLAVGRLAIGWKHVIPALDKDRVRAIPRQLKGHVGSAFDAAWTANGADPGWQRVPSVGAVIALLQAQTTAQG